MVTAEHIGTDESRQDEKTVYWFEVTDPAVDETSTYGIVEGRNPGVVYDDGDPVPHGFERGQALKACVVTDEMRSGA